MEAVPVRSLATPLLASGEVMFTAVSAIGTPEYVKAAEMATRELNAPFLTVMLEGRYTDAYLAEAGKDAPKFTEDELKTIVSPPLDFVGMNVYRPECYVAPSDEPPGYRRTRSTRRTRRRTADGLSSTLGPGTAARQVAGADVDLMRTWRRASDTVADDGHVFVAGHVPARLPHRAAASDIEGVPVDGDFDRSSQDNFEWNAGSAMVRHHR